MENIDKLIRDAGIERTSIHFTSEVMEKIRPLPVPKRKSEAPISRGFTIFMMVIFIGSLVWAVLAGRNGSETELQPGIMMQAFSYLNGLLSMLQEFITTNIWLLPSVVFSVGGVIFLFSYKNDAAYQIA